MSQLDKSYVNLETTPGDLKKMNVNDLITNLRHFRSKIGTQDNKDMIYKLESEILNRELKDDTKFKSRWDKL